MAKVNIGAVEIKRSKGKLTLQGLGKTPRGQKFLAASVEIEAKGMDDPKFKAELAKAMAKLDPESPPTP